MIRNLLATTAIATLIATGAYAQTAPAPAPAAPAEQAAPQVKHADGHLASNLIGETVYSSAGDDGQNIGSVNDLVISPEGDVEAIVVGVGGFLGIGQKNVALEYSLVEWTEREGNEWMVVSTSREALEALPDFDTAAYEPMPADAQVGNTKPATAEEIGAAGNAAATDDMAAAPADDAATDDSAADTGMAAAPADDTTATDDTAAAPADDAATDDMAAAPADDAATDDSAADTGMAAAPADDTTATDDTAAAPADDAAGTDDTQTAAIDRSTLSDVDTAGLSADEFIGSSVYGANDEDIGDVNDVILSQDGQVEAVIVDVGGFLGMGEKSVALSMDNLSFLSDGDGNYYLYTPFSQEELEAQAEYDEATFAENRDDQMMIAPAQ